MTPVRLSTTALVAVLAGLAGCSEDGGAGEAGDSTTSESQSGTSTGTEPGSGSQTSSGSGTDPDDTSGSSGATSGSGSDGGSTTGGETTTGPAGPPRIVFVSDRDGQNGDLYLMDLDGSNVGALTDADVGDSSPTWSPDTTMIAFGRDAGGDDTDIYVVEVASGNETYLATEPALWWWIAWAPDSSQIAFVTDRDGNPDIYVTAPDGTGQTSLTSDSAPDYSPCWPPGGRIFFTAERGGDAEVYSMDGAGGAQTNLTSNSLDEHFPVASRDGSLVAFRRIEDGIRDIYAMSADGTDEVKLTASAGLTTYDTIRWSPDGSYVAFSSSAGMERKILRATVDDEDLIELTDGQARDEGASWTPDSEQLVFTSDRDGDEGEIYLMDADGGNQTRLTNDPAWDHDAAVSPGG